MSLTISDEYFGELLPYIKDEKITDITWNGRHLWIDHLEKGRYQEAVVLSDDFIETFTQRLANLANKNLNASEPRLEAETDELRVSVIDNSVTNTKKSIAIRKTPAVRRLNEAKMIQEKYASKMVISFLAAAVKAHCSFIVTGAVGSGKTELVKLLTKYIPNHERTITIEDNYELRLATVEPELDCVEIKVQGGFGYSEAIKTALRQLCKWLLMSEARGKEVVQLLEAASTGCGIMTTIHSDDVRKIPDRVINMMGAEGDEKKNDVYNFFDVGIKVSVSHTAKGIARHISQICIFDRDNDKNDLIVIYDGGKFTGESLPRNIRKKFADANIKNPLDWDEIRRRKAEAKKNG